MAFIGRGKSKLLNAMQGNIPTALTRLSFALWGKGFFGDYWCWRRVRNFDNSRASPYFARIFPKLRKSVSVFLPLFGLRHARSFLLSFGNSPLSLPQWDDLPWENLSSYR